MGRKNSTLSALGAFGLVAGLAFWAADAAAAPLQVAAGEERPVVVELFTSQGCSSCPPADALLGELAKRPGVVALSFHVDYWDYIGWKDPFASPAYTQRQHDYAASLGLRYVYTPQMVIDGRHDVVGSNRGAVARAIEASAKDRTVVKVTLDGKDGGRVKLSAGQAPADGATVWLVAFDDSHETQVARGENRGRALRDSNVVREMRALGTWTGKAMEFPLDMAAARKAGRGGCAVIVQQGRSGPVLGAAVFSLDSAS